jgi:hypothetical protein
VRISSACRCTKFTSSTRKPQYQLTDQEEFITELLHISGDVWFWPPLNEAQRAGQKIELAQELDWISQSSTKTCRPTTFPCNGHDFLPGHVFKREFSGYCEHVLIPLRQGQTINKKMQAKARAHTTYKWLAQTYAPLLREFGEWRVFMIGGEPMLAMHTIHDGETWRFSIRGEGHTLQQMR